MDFVPDMFAHPSVVIGTAFLGAMYAGACVFTGRRPNWRQTVAFALALFVILVAHGPIDELADRRLFFIHMFEHFLQTLVIPPLLLLGTPDWMLRRWVLSRPIKPIAKFFSKPVISFSIFAAVLVAVHNPPIFDLMCRDESFHIAVHLTFLASGTVLWWPLLSPLPEIPRLSYPAQVMYLFLLMIPMSAVAAPITLAHHIVYPWYAEGPHPWGLTAHADQVLGGLVMWVGQGLYVMCVFSAIFWRWARYEDRDLPAVASSDSVKLARGVSLTSV
jgi:putative membrane protein